MRISHLVLVLGAVLAGCGGTMMTGPDAMRGSLEDAADEDQMYLSVARAVTAMSAMLDEVDRHTSRMDAIMDDMRDRITSMQYCSNIRSMMNLRDGVLDELGAHGATMRAIANLDDARVEVEHHVGRMGTMLDDMDAMLAGMHCRGW